MVGPTIPERTGDGSTRSEITQETRSTSKSRGKKYSIRDKALKAVKDLKVDVKDFFEKLNNYLFKNKGYVTDRQFTQISTNINREMDKLSDVITKMLKELESPISQQELENPISQPIEFKKIIKWADDMMSDIRSVGHFNPTKFKSIIQSLNKVKEAAAVAEGIAAQGIKGKVVAVKDTDEMISHQDKRVDALRTAGDRRIQDKGDKDLPGLEAFKTKLKEFVISVMVRDQTVSEEDQLSEEQGGKLNDFSKIVSNTDISTEDFLAQADRVIEVLDDYDYFGNDIALFSHLKNEIVRLKGLPGLEKERVEKLKLGKTKEPAKPQSAKLQPVKPKTEEPVKPQPAKLQPVKPQTEKQNISDEEVQGSVFQAVPGEADFSGIEENFTKNVINQNADDIEVFRNIKDLDIGGGGSVRIKEIESEAALSNAKYKVARELRKYIKDAVTLSSGGPRATSLAPPRSFKEFTKFRNEADKFHEMSPKKIEKIVTDVISLVNKVIKESSKEGITIKPLKEPNPVKLRSALSELLHLTERPIIERPNKDQTHKEQLIRSMQDIIKLIPKGTGVLTEEEGWLIAEVQFLSSPDSTNSTNKDVSFLIKKGEALSSTIKKFLSRNENSRRVIPDKYKILNNAVVGLDRFIERLKAGEEPRPQQSVNQGASLQASWIKITNQQHEARILLQDLIRNFKDSGLFEFDKDDQDIITKVLDWTRGNSPTPQEFIEKSDEAISMIQRLQRDLFEERASTGEKLRITEDFSDKLANLGQAISKLEKAVGTKDLIEKEIEGTGGSKVKGLDKVESPDVEEAAPGKAKEEVARELRKYIDNAVTLNSGGPRVTQPIIPPDQSQVLRRYQNIVANEFGKKSPEEIEQIVKEVISLVNQAIEERLKKGIKIDTSREPNAIELLSALDKLLPPTERRIKDQILKEKNIRARHLEQEFSSLTKMMREQGRESESGVRSRETGMLPEDIQARDEATILKEKEAIDKQKKMVGAQLREFAEHIDREAHELQFTSKQQGFLKDLRELTDYSILKMTPRELFDRAALLEELFGRKTRGSEIPNEWNKALSALHVGARELLRLSGATIPAKGVQVATNKIKRARSNVVAELVKYINKSVTMNRTDSVFFSVEPELSEESIKTLESLIKHEDLEKMDSEMVLETVNKVIGLIEKDLIERAKIPREVLPSKKALLKANKKLIDLEMGLIRLIDQDARLRDQAALSPAGTKPSRLLRSTEAPELGGADQTGVKKKQKSFHDAEFPVTSRRDRLEKIGTKIQAKAERLSAQAKAEKLSAQAKAKELNAKRATQRALQSYIKEALEMANDTSILEGVSVQEGVYRNSLCGSLVDKLKEYKKENLINKEPSEIQKFVKGVIEYVGGVVNRLEKNGAVLSKVPDKIKLLQSLPGFQLEESQTLAKIKSKKEDVLSTLKTLISASNDRDSSVVTDDRITPRLAKLASSESDKILKFFDIESVDLSKYSSQDLLKMGVETIKLIEKAFSGERTPYRIKKFSETLHSHLVELQKLANNARKAGINEGRLG